MAEKKELPARSTRGRRITQLLGEEALVDEEFWNMEMFKEDVGDEEFSEKEEEEEDVVDADFDNPEEDDAPTVTEEDVVEKKKRKRDVYVDPKARSSKKKKKKEPSDSTSPSSPTPQTLSAPTTPPAVTDLTSAPSSPSTPPKIKRAQAPVPITPVHDDATPTADGAGTPTMRKSQRAVALARNAEREKERLVAEKLKANRPKRKAPVEKRRLTQEELLAEAKITEEINQKSLAAMLKLEEEKKKVVMEKPVITGPRLVYISKNGNNTITFTELDALPPPFRTKPPPLPEKSTCPISGLPARYRDPKTGAPYATIHAFKVLRERFVAKEAERCDKRIAELNALLADKKKKKHELTTKRKVDAIYT